MMIKWKVPWPVPFVTAVVRSHLVVATHCYEPTPIKSASMGSIVFVGEMSGLVALGGANPHLNTTEPSSTL